MVALRPVRESDLPTLFEFQRSPAGNQMAAFTAKDPSDRDAYTAKWTKLLVDPKVTWRAVMDGDSLVGSIVSFDMFGAREVSYWIDESLWGRGIATASLTQFLTEETIRPLNARVAKDNVGSRRVLEKCGFKVIAEERGFANARGCEIDELVLELA